MFGTIGHAHVKPENRQALEAVLQGQEIAPEAGFVQGYLLWPEGKDEVYLVAIFTDRESYFRNADDPAQHQRYLEYRALMEDEPTWADGEISAAQ